MTLTLMQKAALDFLRDHPEAPLADMLEMIGVREEDRPEFVLALLSVGAVRLEVVPLADEPDERPPWWLAVDSDPSSDG